MKNVLIGGALGGAALIVIGLFSVIDTSTITGLTAQLISSQQHQAFRSCIALFTEEKVHDLTITEAELNTDGVVDGIIAYTSNAQCGSAGCVTELCVSDEQGTYTHVPFGFAAQTIRTKETTNLHMHDLVINNDERLTMIWNGIQYTLAEN